MPTVYIENDLPVALFQSLKTVFELREFGTSAYSLSWYPFVHHWSLGVRH
jgi:hypothetical protein